MPLGGVPCLTEHVKRLLSIRNDEHTVLLVYGVQTLQHINPISDEARIRMT